jgi:hypothetical protein
LPELAFIPRDSTAASTTNRSNLTRLWLWASGARTAAFSRSQPTDSQYRKTSSRFCCKALFGTIQLCGNRHGHQSEAEADWIVVRVRFDTFIEE